MRLALILGVLGAVAAALYWRYAVYAGPSPMVMDWTAEGRAILISAAVGFVLGWVVGFALSKIGADY